MHREVFGDGVCMTGAGQVVVGVDIGTTSTKVVAYDTTGRRTCEAEAGYPLAEPQPGYAVQDPGAVLAAVRSSLAKVVTTARDAGRTIAGVSFSSAMHSLIGLDGGGVPLTPSITWADVRATDQAERLRSLSVGAELHRRTGTPVHPMSPLTKLIWFREREPAVFSSAARWVGIKEYVLAHLTGGFVVDRSIASATGLMDLVSLAWWPPALELAGVRTDQLPPIVATTELLAFRPAVAAHLGLEGVPIVVGAGDGPLANLGVGAVRPGVAACSVGTSGAVRVIVEHPGVDPLGRVFCYALTDERWAVGGAVSNGGVVLEWARQALGPYESGPLQGAGSLSSGGPSGAAPGPEASLLALAAQAPPGSDGLLMLPYLLSERAPHWSALARGAYIGLTRAHRRPHLVRAALEGVCQQLALVIEAVRAAGNEIKEIRATGGFLRDTFTRQLLTDVVGSKIGFAAATEGSAFGAALLGMQALGLIETIEMAAGLVPIQETRSPDRANAALYCRQRAIFDGLYPALEPAFRALHQLQAEGVDGISHK
jgi:gluconokinase